MINQLRMQLVLLLVVIFLSGCTGFKAAELVNSGKAVTNNDMESVVPFSMKEHPILIKARLNNSQKEYTFVFDTGALTMIRQEVAQELGLQKGIEVEASDTGGNSKTIDLVKLDRVVVGNMELRDCATGVTDFSDLFSPDIAGILGSNFLRHFIVTIDYRRKDITISRKENHTNAEYKEMIIPFKTSMKNGFAPEIECVVDGGIKGTAIIDTGFSGTVALPLPMVKKTNAFEDGNVIVSKGSMLGGMFGMAEDNYGLRMSELKSGDLKLNNIPTVSYHSKNGHLLLGNRFMNKYIVTLNYPAKKMILIPYGEQFETNIPSYGVALTKHDGKTVVSGIWDNSLASKSGIEVGNEITKVNSIEADTLSLMDLMQMFLDEKTDTIEIEFLNDKGRQEVSLHKEMLLPALK